MRKNVDLLALAVLLAVTGLLSEVQSVATFHDDPARMLATAIHRFDPAATGDCWAHLILLRD